MGLFGDRKPYTAISSETEALLDRGDDSDPSKLLNLIQLIQGSGRGEPGGQEAGRLIRKRIKHGSPSDQAKALSLVETLVDNSVRTGPLIVDSGLGDQLVQLASSHSTYGKLDTTKGAKVSRQCRALLQEWGSRHDKNLTNLFSNAGLKIKAESRRSRLSFHPDDDLDLDVFGSSNDNGGGSSISRRLSRRRSRSVNESEVKVSSPHRPLSHQPESRHSPSRSRSPSPLNLRGASLETTIATAHNVATRLTNALIAHPDGSRDTESYYRQAKQLRRRIIKLIHEQSADVQAFLGELIRANEELIAALQAHDAVIDHKGSLEAQEDHDQLEMPNVSSLHISPTRPPPSPPSSNHSYEASSKISRSNNDVFHESDEENDPFGDDNELLDRPKHTPLW